MSENTELLTPEEVAERLKLDRETVYRALKNKRLRGYKVGWVWRIKAEDLEVFIVGGRS